MNVQEFRDGADSKLLVWTKIKYTKCNEIQLITIIIFMSIDLICVEFICAVLCRFVPCASLRISPDLQCLCFEDVSECAVCGERDPSEVAHSPQFLTMHCSVSFMSK